MKLFIKILLIWSVIYAAAWSFIDFQTNPGAIIVVFFLSSIIGGIGICLWKQLKKVIKF